MPLLDWLTVPWLSVARIIVSAVAIFVWLLFAVRVTGLRTFSKMASVDFAVTVAIGTVVASTVTSTSTTVAEGAVTLAMLRYSQIRAVVLETTGDISVLHGPDPVEPDLLEGVRDSDRVDRFDAR